MKTIAACAILPLAAQAFVPSLPTRTLQVAKMQPLRATQGFNEDDLVDKSTTFLDKAIKGLQKEVKVPTSLVPPRVNEQGQKETTILAAWPFFAGISLAFGNVIAPIAFYASLYITRPTETADWAAGIVALLATSIIKPIIDGFNEITDLDESFNLGGLTFLGGTLLAFLTLASVTKEGNEVFRKGQEELDNIRNLKENRDLKFTDIKLNQKDINRKP